VEMALAISLMLAVVSTSYRQVCRAYPSGGGAYTVAKENLGQTFGLIAAGALMIDYVMTVAVSTASAVAQAYSVWPALYDVRVEVGILSIAIITLGNLRGLRESGNIFALPTYAFLGLAFRRSFLRGPRRSRSSSCCAPLRVAPSLSPAWRRSPTAFLRSSRRNRATRPTR
jgi:hypothetical protein